MKVSLKILVSTLIIQLNLNCQDKMSEPICISERITIYSEVLGEDREIYIYAPAFDEELNNLPVVFVLDAYSQFNQTVSTVDYLSAVMQGNDVIPHSLVVGITNPNRDRDLTPVKGIRPGNPASLEITGGGGQFLEFITTELIPYLDKTYNTCNHRTIIGHSLGGLLIFQALLEKREYFDNYLTIDPALGFANRKYLNEIYDTLNTADLSDESLFFAAANNRPTYIPYEELAKDTSEFLEMMDKPNMDFYNKEEADNWKINLIRKNYQEETHFTAPFKVTFDALNFFFDYYSFKEMIDYFHPAYVMKKDLVYKLKIHYKNISNKIGHEIKPLESYLNAWLWGLATAEREDLAIDLLNYGIELYPKRPSIYATYGNFLRHIGDNKKAIEQYEKSLELRNDRTILEAKNDLIKEIKNNE